jgi:hypothetical protein
VGTQSQERQCQGLKTLTKEGITRWFHKLRLNIIYFALLVHRQKYKNELHYRHLCNSLRTLLHWKKCSKITNDSAVRIRRYMTTNTLRETLGSITIFNTYCFSDSNCFTVSSSNRTPRNIKTLIGY